MQLLITHARFSVYCTICFLLIVKQKQVSSLHTLFLKTFNKRSKLVFCWIILKGNTSRFCSAIQILPSDIGEYLSSFFNPVAVVVFILSMKTVFFSIVKFFGLKESLLTYLLTYLLAYLLYNRCMLNQISRLCIVSV